MSVAGERAPYTLLAEATGQPADQVLDSLEAARRARLVDEADDQTWCFAYGVVRRVVEHDMTQARRTMLTRRLDSVPARGPVRFNERSPEQAALRGASDPDLEERSYHLSILRRQQRFRSS